MKSLGLLPLSEFWHAIATRSPSTVLAATGQIIFQTRLSADEAQEAWYDGYGHDVPMWSYRAFHALFHLVSGKNQTTFVNDLISWLVYQNSRVEEINYRRNTTLHHEHESVFFADLRLDQWLPEFDGRCWQNQNWRKAIMPVFGVDGWQQAWGRQLQICHSFQFHTQRRLHPPLDTPETSAPYASRQACGFAKLALNRLNR